MPHVASPDNAVSNATMHTAVHMTFDTKQQSQQHTHDMFDISKIPSHPFRMFENVPLQNQKFPYILPVDKSEMKHGSTHSFQEGPNLFLALPWHHFPGTDSQRATQSVFSSSKSSGVACVVERYTECCS